MSALRDAIAAWLRGCADRMAPAANDDPQPPLSPTPVRARPIEDADGPDIPSPPAAPPAHATPEQIRAAMNRRLIQRVRQDRQGVVTIEHLGRIS